MNTHDMRELGEATKEMQEIEKAPLSERKEAQADVLRVMKEDPALFAERLGWLIDGNYGYGQMLKAKQIVSSPRMNRPAALSQLVAAFEWKCPPRMAVDAWKKLTKTQQQALDAAIAVVIEAAEKEES
jgi:hypothetical protein